METKIPDRVATKIQVRVPDASIGSHVCFEGSANIKRLPIEPTLSLVQEGQVTVALAVDTTCSPIKIKHGLKFGE